MYIHYDWLFGLIASILAVFSFTRKSKRALLWSTIASGFMVSLTFSAAGDVFAGDVVVASVLSNLIQGFLDERFTSGYYNVIRVTVGLSTILVATLISPPTSWISLLVFIAYANARIAHAMPNVTMKIWIIPTTLLYMLYALISHIYPVVMLEVVTLIANLFTITKMSRATSQVCMMSEESA